MGLLWGAGESWAIRNGVSAPMNETPESSPPLLPREGTARRRLSTRQPPELCAVNLCCGALLSSLNPDTTSKWWSGCMKSPIAVTRKYIHPPQLKDYRGPERFQREPGSHRIDEEDWLVEQSRGSWRPRRPSKRVAAEGGRDWLTQRNLEETPDSGKAQEGPGRTKRVERRRLAQV